VKNLLKALAAAKAEMPDPKKNAANPHFKNKFADLGQVMDCLEVPLANHGLVVTQTMAEGNVLVTTLWHAESGESLESRMTLMPAKNDPQGQGSAITYGRRYMLKAMFGMVDVDDDGNAASGQRPAKQQPRDTVPAEAPAKKVLHPIETFGEACGLIADVTTDRELREVGLRIAASKFEKQGKDELKALYEQRAKEFRG